MAGPPVLVTVLALLGVLPAWTTEARAGPPPLMPIQVEDRAAAVCPDRHAAQLLFELLTGDNSEDEEAKLRQRYDRAVARWAVCARFMGLSDWKVPAVQDRTAEILLSAALTEPGHRNRLEAIREVAEEMPVAAGLLALQELSVIRLVERVEPPQRLRIAAAAVGAWGCGDSLHWFEDPRGDAVGICTDGRDISTMASQGLVALAQLSQPLQNGTGWLADGTRNRVQELWATIGEVHFPVEQAPPLRVPVGGVGAPLDPNLGWFGRIGPDLVGWERRPAFHLTPDGIAWQRSELRTRAPSDWDGAPVLYIDGNTNLKRLDEVLTKAHVQRPIFVARKAGSADPKELVELRLMWQPDESPEEGAAVVQLGAIGGSRTAMRQTVEQAQGNGPAWILAHPDARWADLVTAHGAVAELRSGPVVVSLPDE